MPRKLLRSGGSAIAKRKNELWYRRRLKTIAEDLKQEVDAQFSRYLASLDGKEGEMEAADRVTVSRNVHSFIHSARERFTMPINPSRTADYAARINLHTADQWWARQIRGWVDINPAALPQPRIGDAPARPRPVPRPRRRVRLALQPGAIEPLSALSIIRGQEAIEAAFDAAIETNVSLITSIPAQHFDRLQEVLFDHVQSAERWESLSDKLRDGIAQVNDLADYRVDLIARDQTSKMSATFNRVRSQSVGINQYTWQTAGDERVRETHVANEGKVFSFDEPPEETGNPGDDINCRCAAVPYVEVAEEEAA